MEPPFDFDSLSYGFKKIDLEGDADSVEGLDEEQIGPASAKSCRQHRQRRFGDVVYAGALGAVAFLVLLAVGFALGVSDEETRTLEDTARLSTATSDLTPLHAEYGCGVECWDQPLYDDMMRRYNESLIFASIDEGEVAISSHQVVESLSQIGHAHQTVGVAIPIKSALVSQYLHTHQTTALQAVKTHAKTSSWHLRNYALRLGEAALTSIDFSSAFVANITFGTQEFPVIIDTGSSDTWLIKAGFTCVNQTTNATLPASTCGFGSSGDSFIDIPDENFYTSYGDGEYLYGTLGLERVTFAGIEIKNQEVALPLLAAWSGDGISSGLVGLAYSSITNAFPGTNSSNDEITGNITGNNMPYSSILNTIFIDQLSRPMFSLALSRSSRNTSPGGMLAIGGIPHPHDPIINATGSFTVKPIEPSKPQLIDPTHPELQFYTITIDTLVYDGVNVTSHQYIVDSGTTLMYVPTQDSKVINGLFDPPARVEEGLYLVNCNATAPDMGIRIGGTLFELNPVDLILDEDIPGGLCISGIQSGPVGHYILGDTFLNNVLAVFDIGAAEMAFSPRPFYSSQS
ncbi:hypothetical protein CLAIMM_09817 [Cladophialophora immunda]|nr:hypothetical protein CLAIMM_09817 [Cladophialophora immunda]